MHKPAETTNGTRSLIFVSIAAYRDPQLLATIQDCLAKASFPERLRFGICRQADATEEPLRIDSDRRFRVLDIDWRQSQGACWARAEIMKQWQGEDWFLQVDSHCRFAASWDATLIQAAAETGSAKPILSTYASPFTPGEIELLQGPPLQIQLQAFTPEGIPQLMPAEFPLPRPAGRSPRARFLSAGFLFAPGRFVKEVPYDPELYFMGEESAMTVRAFTHGYDLFHPAETIVRHDYIRADARKHWGDHTVENSAPRPWSDLDERSRAKVQRLLSGEPVESFALGTDRTLADYEAYAGLSFRRRRAQQQTMRGKEPPNAPVSSDWAEKIHPWIARIRLQRSQLPEGALDDPAIWCVAVLDEDGYEICRKDLTREELAPLHGNDREIAVICEFPSETVPARWTIWPLSRPNGWLRKIGGPLGEEDFAILKDEDDL